MVAAGRLFIATQLNSTQLNSVELTQLNSVQPISAKEVSRVFVYDVINGPLTCVEFSRVELSCVAINTPLSRLSMLPTFQPLSENLLSVLRAAYRFDR